MENSHFEISKEAIDHLNKVDQKLKRLIARMGVLEREIIADPFTALVQSIVYQQLAYAAANTIWGRFLSTVGDVSPSKINNMPDSIHYFKNFRIVYLIKHIPAIPAVSDNACLAQAGRYWDSDGRNARRLLT